MSDDEFDDLDPTLFNDPSVLASVSELETAHVAASQVVKQASTTQPKSTLRYHHKLHKPTRPAPAAVIVEDDYDAFPDIGVDEDGHYELKDTRYPVRGATNAVAGPSRQFFPRPTPQLPKPVKVVPKPAPPVRSSQLGNRGPLARSVSMGSQNLSQGSINRMNAIRQASQSPVMGSQQTTALPLPGVPRRTPDVPAAAAQVRAMEAQVKSMQAQLELLQKARDSEVEERRKAENNIYAYKGEAENMRRAVEEAKAKHKADAEAWRLKHAELGEQMRQKENETKQKLEAMSSNMAFKTHNIMQSAARPRTLGGTPQSQARLPPPAFGISTPGRATPRKGSVNAMLPAQVNSATPFARRGHATPAKAMRGFSHLQNGFDTASPIPTKRARTEAKSPSRDPPSSPLIMTPGKGKGKRRATEGTSSPRQSSPVENGDVEMDDWNGHTEMIDDTGIETLVLEDGFSAVDEKAEVLHTIFTSQYPNQWAEDDAQPALQQIMHCDVDKVSPTHVKEIHTAFTDLLNGCGSTTQDADDLAEVAILSLTTVAAILLESEKLVETATTLALIGSLKLLRPASAPGMVSSGSFGDILKLTTRLIRALASSRSKETGSMLSVQVQQQAVGVALRLKELLRIVSWVTPGPLETRSEELLLLILALLDAVDRPELLGEATRLLCDLALRPEMFRLLLKTESRTSQSTLVERLCKLLQNPVTSLGDAHGLETALHILDTLCMLAASDADAVVLLGNGTSSLVPTLVTILERESSYIWGLLLDPSDLDNSLTLLNRALTLLHFLVLPPPLPLRDPPLDGKSPPGVDLAHALHNASSKDFNGLPHVFIAAIGRISYAEVGDGAWSPNLMRSIQYLAQDLLEIVVEGPEGDFIYEVFVAEEESAEEPAVTTTADDEEADAMAAEMDQNQD